jgi:hypothetical protein
MKIFNADHNRIAKSILCLIYCHAVDYTLILINAFSTFFCYFKYFFSFFPYHIAWMLLFKPLSFLDHLYHFYWGRRETEYFFPRLFKNFVLFSHIQKKGRLTLDIGY